MPTQMPAERIAIDVLEYGIPRSLRPLFSTKTKAFSPFAKAFLFSRCGIKLPPTIKADHIRPYLSEVPADVIHGDQYWTSEISPRVPRTVMSAEATYTKYENPELSAEAVLKKAPDAVPPDAVPPDAVPLDPLAVPLVTSTVPTLTTEVF